MNRDCSLHPVACHVVQRNSSATKFDRVEITFILALFYLAEPLIDEDRYEAVINDERYEVLIYDDKYEALIYDDRYEALTYEDRYEALIYDDRC